jgi:hypothetical protein
VGLATTAPAFAQSDAFKQASQQMAALFNAGKFSEAAIWAQKAADLAKTEYGENSTDGDCRQCGAPAKTQGP